MRFTPSSMRGSRTKVLDLTRLAVGATVLGLILTACTSASDDSGGRGASGGTLRVGVVDGPTSSLDPYAPVTTEGTETADYQMLNGLVNKTKDGLEWDLAVGLEHNADNTVWTVKLRPDVKFHDGSTFGADDVIATTKRILDPLNAIDFADELSFMDINGIKKVDDLTVEFTLKRPYGPFKYAISDNSYMILKAGSDPDKVVGTGPFKLKSYTPGVETVVTRFDDYWGGKPKLDAIKIISFKSSEAVTNALIGGQIDVTSNVSPVSIQTINSTPGLKVLKSEPNRAITVSMRTDVEPFNDVRVRQAMRLLIDRELVLENAFGGEGVISNDFEMGNTPPCAPDVPQRTQDLEKAKQLLADAGYLDHEFVLNSASNKPGKVAVALILADGAKKAGLNFTVNKVAIGPWLDKWGEWEFYTTYNTAQYMGVIPGYMAESEIRNAQRWHNEEYNALGRKLFSSSDEAEQCEIMKKMKRIQWESGPSVIAATNPTVSAYSDKVHGLFTDVPTGALYDFYDVTMSN